jgi:multiple sugar transport system ATP-binding protein
MNFFDAHLTADGENLIADANSFKIVIDAQHAAPFRDHTGQEIILGIRPEDLHDAKYIPSGITPYEMSAEVEVVEQMGNEVVVYLNEKGVPMVARFDPRTDAEIGSRIDIVVNIDNIHIFDTSTKLSLAYDHKAGESVTA